VKVHPHLLELIMTKSQEHICPLYDLLLKLDHVKREFVTPRFFEVSGAAVEAFQSN